MSRKRTPPSDPNPWAGQISPEDGSDPKAFHEKPWQGHRKAGRKASQLCEQVADALRGILLSSASEVLQNLIVVFVRPAPHTGRLRVTVAVPAPADVAERTHASEQLLKAASWIRQEVTAAIHRRKAPELIWEVVGEV